MTDRKTPPRIALTMLSFIVLFGSACLSQAESLSDTLAPCLEEQTFAVVRLDLTRIDIATAFDLVAQTVPEARSSEEAASSLKDFSEDLQDDLNLPKLRAAGAECIYLLLSTNDLPHVLAAIPVGAPSDAAQVAEWFKDIDAQTLRKSNLVLAGSESVLSRWADKPSQRRPDLDRVAAAAKPGAAQVLLAPDADTRRVVEALLTSWPEPKLPIPTGAITNGLQWGTLTVTWPPELSLDLHIEAADPASAEALGQAIDGMLDIAASLQGASEAVPDLGSILAPLQPEIEGRVLSLNLDRQQSTRIVATLIAPQVLQVREQAKRVYCGSCLRQIALGVHMYAQDHDNRLPPNLQAIADAGMLPVELLSCEGRPYIYRAADLPNLNVSPMMILAYDSAGAHRGGRTVVFVDGHVEWTNEAHFAELIARDNQLRREHGLPEKPAE